MQDLDYDFDDDQRWLHGDGCPLACRFEHARTLVSHVSERPDLTGSVYFVEATGTSRVKVGWTQGPVVKRRSALQTGSSFPLDVVAAFPGSREDEQLVHRLFARQRVAGEWFHFRDWFRVWIQDWIDADAPELWALYLRANDRSP